MNRIRIGSSSGMNLKSAIRNLKFAIIMVALLLVLSFSAEAQQPKVYRVGVITSGGLWYETIDGLRLGLQELGLYGRA